MTYGEKAVGLTFNPSGDDDVVTVKRDYAKTIDMLFGCEIREYSEAGRVWAERNSWPVLIERYRDFFQRVKEYRP